MPSWKAPCHLIPRGLISVKCVVIIVYSRTQIDSNNRVIWGLKYPSFKAYQNCSFHACAQNDCEVWLREREYFVYSDFVIPRHSTYTYTFSYSWNSNTKEQYIELCRYNISIGIRLWFGFGLCTTNKLFIAWCYLEVEGIFLIDKLKVHNDHALIMEWKSTMSSWRTRFFI